MQQSHGSTWIPGVSDDPPKNIDWRRYDDFSEERDICGCVLGNHSDWRRCDKWCDGSTTITYPTWGHYQTAVRTQDFEGKSSTPNLIMKKINTYSAPSSPSGFYDSDRSIINFSWVRPIIHTDNSPIDPTRFQGYLISLREINTGKILYTYKVLGYSQIIFTTPNVIPPGQYNFSICGLSNDYSEGECAISSQIIVLPSYFPPPMHRRHSRFANRSKKWVPENFIKPGSTSKRTALGFSSDCLLHKKVIGYSCIRVI